MKFDGGKIIHSGRERGKHESVIGNQRKQRRSVTLFPGRLLVYIFKSRLTYTYVHTHTLAQGPTEARLKRADPAYILKQSIHLKVSPHSPHIIYCLQMKEREKNIGTEWKTNGPRNMGLHRSNQNALRYYEGNKITKACKRRWKDPLVISRQERNHISALSRFPQYDHYCEWMWTTYPNLKKIISFNICVHLLLLSYVFTYRNYKLVNQKMLKSHFIFFFKIYCGIWLS